MNAKQVTEKQRIPLLIGTTAVLVLAISAACCVALERYFLAEGRAQAMQISSQKARDIDRQLNHGLSVTYALAGLVKLEQGLVANFQSVAQELLPQYPEVSALQLAPGGIVRQAIPLAGNEKAIGHKLLDDNQRNKEARLAVETRRLTLAGPFPLIQGGEAMVGRLPVFLGKAEGEFWGFTIAMIRLDDFHKAIDLGSLEQYGYAYELWRIHPDTGARQVFAKSVEALAASPVTTSIEVPNGQWFLGIAPVGQWWDKKRVALEAAISILLTFAASIALAWHLRTRRRLLQNEIRYKTLYEATPAMLHSINAEGKIISVSQAWLDTLGYTRDEVIGRSSAEFLTEEARKYAVATILPEFFRTGLCKDVAYQMVARDGRVLEVLLSACGERDEQGNIVRSLAVIQDVTEQKRIAGQLHQVLSEQKAIIENDLVGIVRVKDRISVWANPAFERMLGYGPGELNGTPTRQNYPDEESYLAFGQAAYPVLLSGQVFHSQFQQRHKDGRIVWLNVSGGMLDRSTGESLWAFVDISELKDALSCVARSEQRMDLALAGANLGMWDWHLPSDTMACNPRMHQMLGHADGEIVLSGSCYASLINLSDYPRVRQTLIAHLSGETSMYEAEYRVRHADEHWIWVLCRGKVVERDETGKAIRMTGTNLDISERKTYEATILEREARLANLIASIQDLVIVFDAGGVVVEYFYPSQGTHPFKTADLPSGGAYIESLPEEIALLFVNAMGEILVDGHSKTLEYSFEINGQQLISVATVSPVLSPENPFATGFLAVVRDVTQKRQSQQRIEQLSRRNTLLLESVGEGVFGVDPDGKATFVNSTALTMLGLTEEDILGRPTHALFHHQHENGEHYPENGCPVFKTLRDGKHRRSDTECFWRKDGSHFPVALNVAPVIEDGVSQGAVVVFQDITERRHAEAVIRHLAFYDPLTQLPNRRLLTDRLKHALATSKRTKSCGALFFLDLDNFKRLNDTYGHDVGDQLLQQVANRLLACVREVDTVARLGGDEFVLLCEGLGSNLEKASECVDQIGKKVLAALNEQYVLGTSVHTSTPSVGVSLFADTTVATDELLKQADMAMYQAKSAGRNTIRIFDPSSPGVTTGAELLK